MKRIGYLLFIPFLLINLTACNKKTEEVNLYQNDFYGSVMRAENVADDVVSVLDEIQEKNSSIKDENPSDFWSSSEFAYLSSELMDDSLLHEIYTINEVEEWDDVVSTVVTAYSEKADSGEIEDLNLVRNSANDYTLTYLAYEETFDWSLQTLYDVEHEIDIKYDANHDWTQVLDYVTYNDTKILVHIFEYGRYGNTYVIQTDKERIVAQYKDVYEENSEESIGEDGSHTTTTTAVLVGEEIEKFYYCQLDGENFKRNVFSYNESEDEAIDKYGFKNGSVTRDFELANQYGLTDTIFEQISDIDKSFVTELGNYSKLLLYEKGILTAKVNNTLANQTESFVFNEDGTCERSFDEKEDTTIKVYYTEYETVNEDDEPIIVGQYTLEDGTELETLGSGENLILKYNDTYYNVVKREYNADGSLNSVIIDIADEETVEEVLEEEKEKEEESVEEPSVTEDVVSDAIADSSSDTSETEEVTE